MKATSKFLCFFVAVLMLITSLPAGATSAPANPMSPPGFGIIATATPVPTATPTAEPTKEPTAEPTKEPTKAPTAEPTKEPTKAPTAEPTKEPTKVPTEAPTAGPTENAAPAAPGSDYIADEILSEEIVALLDEEVRDYLTGTGELIDTVDGVRNILLVGLDARPGETQSRSDTMVIVTLDGNANQIRMTSLMRDMYVSIPGHGNNRINAAWVYGGHELLLETIEQNFGLTIEDYVAVELRALIDVIDALGGLTLTVETKSQLRAINGVIDAFNYQFREPTNDGLLTELGEQLMNGKQVQAYARYRKIDSDAQRTARQREVLTKLFDKLQTKSVLELTKIAFGALEYIDTNMSLSEIVSMIPVMYGMSDADFDQLTIPYDLNYQNKTVRGMAVLVADMDECREALEKFVNGADLTEE